jgi:hypothetical protein
MQALGGVVDVGDVPAAFLAVDRDRVAAIARLLHGLEAHPGTPRLVMRYQRRRPAAPRRRPSHVYVGARVWHDGDELVVRLDDATVGARATRDAAWIGGDSEDLDHAWQQLFHFTVTHLLAHHHRYVVHAAGLVAENGDAYVVLGPTGQGKSTLALAALASGWRLLSDDLVVIRQGASGPEASGIARRVALPGDLGAVLAAPTPPILGDHRGRRDFGVEHLSRGWHPVAGIIEVGHSASPDGDLQALYGEQAMYRVLGSFSSVTDPLLVTKFFPVAGALCQLPRWRVGHGVEPGTRLDVAQRLLEELAAT